VRGGKAAKENRYSKNPNMVVEKEDAQMKPDGRNVRLISTDPGEGLRATAAVPLGRIILSIHIGHDFVIRNKLGYVERRPAEKGRARFMRKPNQ